GQHSAARLGRAERGAGIELARGGGSGGGALVRGRAATISRAASGGAPALRSRAPAGGAALGFWRRGGALRGGAQALAGPRAHVARAAARADGPGPLLVDRVAPGRGDPHHARSGAARAVVLREGLPAPGLPRGSPRRARR